jgi:two-component system invasion response regulator UvrY
VINVILVDDHQIVRSGIRRILADTSGIRIVGEASSGEESVKLVRSENVDVVLMDIHMEGIGGLEATRKILHHNPNIKVLVLTVSDDEIYPVRFLKTGAAGYLTKDCEATELVQAVKQVYQGKRYISAVVAQQLALKRFDDKNSPFDLLSERELQVLLMITRGEKAPKIAEQLHLSTKTVNTYRYRIFTKLGVNSDVEMTHLALRYNIISGHLPGEETSEQ